MCSSDLSAPGGPEIHQDRFFGLDKFVIEAGFTQIFYVWAHVYLLLLRQKNAAVRVGSGQRLGRTKESLESEKESDGGLCQVGNFVEM